MSRTVGIGQQEFEKKMQTLEDAAAEALDQIDRMHYAADLGAKGISPERIRKYGFAFEGKKVLISSD